MLKLHSFLFCAVLTLHPFLIATAEELKLLYYESFDSGKEEGVVGKAGTFRAMEARGIIDLDRGTLALFLKSVKAPAASEWERLAGASTMRGAGYWDMLLGFDMQQKEFLFNFHDVGRYAPPLRLQPNLGRWKVGEWHHLAAVWDRNEGVSVYENGQRVNSNWGEHRWEWNLLPETFSVSGVADELYIYAVPLTDAQIAQLAKGEKPTGSPIPLTPAEIRQPRDLARMGWSGLSLAEMPAVEAGKPQEFTFANIRGCVDAKRPVSQPFDGFPWTTWPHIEYGAYLRGQHLDIHFAPGQAYDRVRVFTHRKFSGQFMRQGPEGKEVPLVPLEAPHATLWHHRLPSLLTDEHLVLKRKVGRLGQIDFYRVQRLKSKPSAKKLVSFTFSKAESFPDTELGKTLMGETPTRFQQPLLATKQAAAPWTLATPAFGGFQAVAEAPEDSKAFEGALVELIADNLAEPTPVRIQIKEPVHGMRDWLVADAVLQPKGTGRQTFTLLLKGRPVINMPPLRVPEGKEIKDAPGTSFGVTVTAANPVNWSMGEGGCSLKFVVTEIEKALPVAAEFQEEVMREAYADVMEGHAYGNKRLVFPMKWLAKFAPERIKFRQMYERAGSPQWFEGIAVPKLVYTEPKNTTGAPEWAFWQMEAMKEHRRLIHAIIDDQQLWDGEYGGVWNDDTDHIENWYCHALCMDDDGRIRNSLRLFCDGLWNYQLEEGVGKYVQDTCHFYEEGMGSISMRMLIDFGDPIVFERVLTAASHYEKWLRKGEDGRYLWISDYVSVNGAWTYDAFLATGGIGGHKFDTMIPAGYLIWYNRHPGAAEYYRTFPVMDGFHGSVRDRVTDFAAARKRYAEEALKPLGRYGPRQHLVYIDETGLNDEIRKAHRVEYKPAGPIAHYWGARDTDDHFFRYLLTGDTRFLVDSYKRVCEWFYSHDWINTGAMPSMDRNPLPRFSLIRARIGSLAANRGASGLNWPLYGLSYEKGANDLAALVTENLETKLAVRLYPFTDKPHDVQIRVWRLHPGRYRMTLSKDTNDDGKPEETFLEKEMALDRGAFVDFSLPPRQCSILALTPIQTTEMNYDRPDPAISDKTVDYVYNEHLVVRVHNIGTKPVENLLVRVRDGRSGRPVVMGEQRIERIDPPLDFKPKHKGVEFKNINANTYGSIIIEIDPDKEIDDLNRYNNRVVVEY